MKKLPVAVSMGDPAGVGPEIVLQALQKERVWNTCLPLVVGDLTILEAIRKKLGFVVDLKPLDPLREDIIGGPSLIPVWDIGKVTDPRGLEIGKVTALSGEIAVECVSRCVELALKNQAIGIATAPINKEALKKAGHRYIGHTEMLSEMSGSTESVTMFLVDTLKIFFYSRHTSLKNMIQGLSVEGILKSIRLADACLKSIGIRNRKLALAALNPHASDGGLFGEEEELILKPGVAKARGEGINVTGPVPADSVFHMALTGAFDAVISLYHDQGHIAAKTYDFFRTVSVTFGLPFIRTSVDHGTAFDIAWQGIANPVSMEEAVISCGLLANSYDPKALRGLS